MFRKLISLVFSLSLVTCNSLPLLLSLRELEAFSGAFLTVFLSLFNARVSCQHSLFFKLSSKVRVNLHQCLCNAMSYGASLTRHAAAVDFNRNVIFPCNCCCCQRLLYNHYQCLRGEIFVERNIVDVNIPLAMF